MPSQHNSKPPRVLSAVGNILRAVARTIVPETSQLDEAGWSRLEGLIEVSLRDRPEAIKRRLRLFLRLVQWWPVIRYARPFTSLHPAQRVRFLSSLENHPMQLVRTGFWGLRALILLGYYGQPEIAREIGYTPDPRGWEALR